MRPVSIPIDLHPEKLLTTEQVAAITGISQHTFERWRCRRDGGPKFQKLGTNTVRYRWADVKAWVDAGTVTPTAASAAA